MSEVKTQKKKNWEKREVMVAMFVKWDFNERVFDKFPSNIILIEKKLFGELVASQDTFDYFWSNIF